MSRMRPRVRAVAEWLTVRGTLKHPARLVSLSFLAAVLVGSVLLMLPVSREGVSAASPLTALFTATSAVCVTGLTTVDTATYWSPFGQGVIMILIQVGGFGIMTLASMLGLAVSRRLRLRERIITQAETKATTLRDVPLVVRRVALISLITEAALAVALTMRFYFGYDYAPGRAVWHGVFHAISSFNNAGFALYSDNLEGFVADPLITMPIGLVVIIGGIGFPVVYELARKAFRPGAWSLHTKLTVTGTAVLLLIGFATYLVFEWDNSKTLGPLGIADKVSAAMFSGIMPRTAGFNAIPLGEAHQATLAITDGLMVIGGGSAGTAGGIKIATVFLLTAVIWAEVRGEPDVSLFRRRIDSSVQRQALTVTLLGIGIVAVSALALVLITDFSLQSSLFESASAFGTAGLSTGITPDLPSAAQLIVTAEMYAGRVGPIALATALALRPRKRRFRQAEAPLLIG